MTDDNARGTSGEVDVNAGDGGGSGAMTTRSGARRPRLRWVVVIIAIVFIAVYVSAVVLYARSGDVKFAQPNPPKPPAGGVLVELTPQSVNASGQRTEMDLSIIGAPSLVSDSEITPNQTINVVIAPTGGDQSITFPKGEVPATVPVTVISEGEIETWPFDSYTTQNLNVVACRTSCATGEVLPTRVYFTGHVPGWAMNASVRPDNQSIHFTASRSSSTIVFGVVLLALMVVMPCLTLFVGVSTLVGKRKVEPSFMSWMAAMLFATIPLRTFLPGSPPIGSWVDYTIVLWVLAGLVAGLVVYVVAWARQRA